MNQEQIDEVLEMLWVFEEQPAAGSTPSGQRERLSENSVLPEMQARGLLTLSGAQPALTEAGRRQAAGIIRSHRIAERLLRDILNLEDTRSEREACTFEHNLTPGIVDSICTLLGHPRECPHGNPIPEGECCRQVRESLESVVTSLPNLRLGEHGVVAYLSSRNFGRIKKLYTFGVVPGAELRLLQHSPAIVVQVEETQIALERPVAEDVFVRREENPSY